MTISSRGGTANSVGSTSTTLTLPTGQSAGDLLFAIIRVGSSAAQTWSQSGGTGTWTKQYDAADSAGGYSYTVWWRVMAGGDTAPTFSWTTSTTVTWACGGFFSSTGGTLSIDTWATELDTGTSSNSVTPNPATAAGSGEASIILSCARAATETTPASHTYTAPTGWTLPSGGDVWIGSANSRWSATVYQLGLSGTVTPGAETLTDASSGAYFFSVAHALVTETAAAGATPAPLVVPQAAVMQAANW